MVTSPITFIYEVGGSSGVATVQTKYAMAAPAEPKSTVNSSDITNFPFECAKFRGWSRKALLEAIYEV